MQVSVRRTNNQSAVDAVRSNRVESSDEDLSMNDKLKRFKSRALFTLVGGVLVINPLYAQDTTEKKEEDPKELETLVVSGIRNSLEDSMGIKREAVGVVDAISAEDIGKFPDTNLAESLQRITGISIERRDGEGA